MRHLLLAALLVGVWACSGDVLPPPAAVGLNPGETDVQAASCADDAALFERVAWTGVVQRCSQCHVTGGVASSTRFVLTATSVPDWRVKNEAVVRALAAVDVEGEPLLLLKATARHSAGHGGGRIVAPGSEAELTLQHWIERLRGKVPCDAEPVTCSNSPGPRMLRRLTHVEYRNTVRDLLGLDAEVATRFAADRVVEGFRNNSGALRLSALLADQYRAAAEGLAQQAVTTKLNTLVPCWKTNTVKCAASFVRDFGKRAFRRPLTQAELQRFTGVFHTVALEDGFREGIRWALTAMLQSPHFLYRVELGARGQDGTFALTDYELATELSYLFLETMPDAELFAAAEAGALRTPEGLSTQVTRLAAHPGAVQSVTRFFNEWLGVDRLLSVPRDAETYPDLTPAIRVAMKQEFDKFIADLALRGGSLSEALVSPRTFASDALAAYYRIPAGTGPADAEGFRSVPLEGTPYSGLLSMGAVLVTYALPASSSPIHRGIFVREHLLCQPLPPPPANIDASPPPMDPTKTTRQRYAEHSSNPQCSGCHNRIDPIGFGFEAFDGAGRHRTSDGVHPIDPRGEILESVSTNGTFEGVRGLAQLLAQSDEVQECYRKTWAKYAFGLEHGGALACAVGAGASMGDDLTGLRRALTSTLHFTRRSGASTEGDTPGTGEARANVDALTFSELPPPDPLHFELIQESRWDSGACFKGVVTNLGTAPLTWSTAGVRVEGTINSIWSAVHTVEGELTSFSGAAHNATLQPQTSTEFGFCVSF